VIANSVCHFHAKRNNYAKRRVGRTLNYWRIIQMW